MSELISQWIQSRLGLIVNMSAESFAVKTADGRLLAEILFSYGYIAQEQLNLITHSNYVSDCYNNFKYLKLWLNDLRVTLEDEDIYEIVHGLGTASLHLFYQVYLEFRNKSKLDIVMQNEIQSQLGTKHTRFEVTKTTAKASKVCELNKDTCTLALIGGDAYHWYRDRMESLQSRCKEARNEYIHTMMGLCKSGSERREYSLVLPRSLVLSPRQSMSMDPLGLCNDDISTDDTSYETLVEMQKTAQQIQPIVPDVNIANKIISDIKSRHLAKQENKIIRTEMHLEILNEFENKLNENKAKYEDKVITDILLKQSNYEKILMSKMAQVKIQKEFMLENKFIQGDQLNKIKEREFVNSLLVKEKDLNQNKLAYYMERDRLLQLHLRVWNERMRLRAQRHEDTCVKVVRDLVDVSIHISEYKKRFGQEMSKREMVDLKHLFLGEQPVIDSFAPMVHLIENSSGDIEEIIDKEITRQDVIDMEEFESYMNFEWPWELKNVSTTPEILDQIDCGLNVLGHVVHQLLTAKYPESPAPEVPHFPQVIVRVCINSFNDLNSLPILRNLLKNREIEVIQMTQAVNYCIEAFNNERKREYEIDKQDNNNETKKAKSKTTKAPKKGAKSKTMAKSSKTEVSEEPSKEYDNKIVQTPIKFPWEEIEFSRQAILGRTGQELLDVGQPLTDFLLVAMFIKYLKSIPNLKGWVLINFPNNFDQAVILEQAFTGINVLNMSEYEDKKSILEIADLEEGEKDTCSLTQQQEHTHKSELLPVPYKTEPVIVYDTFLTAYIKLKPFPTDEHVSEDASLPPGFEALEDNPDPLDKFYSDTGVNYSMYCKDMDFATIKHLAKLVIGDYSLPLKSSLELFGTMGDKDANEESMKGLKATKKGEKLKKPKIKVEKSNTANEVTASEKEPQGKKGAKKNLKAVIVHEDKSVQVPEDDEEVEVIFVKEERDAAAISAGQPGWDYVRLPVSEEYLISLASFWEVVEEIYINDMKQLFFLKRTKMNLIVPFAQYIKEAMETCIEKPDYKSYYLAKFQRAFNAFDLDYRKDNEYKAEMHCRISDFQEKMFEMCDEKMITAENKRCKIIKANWAPKEMCALANDYINMMQIELDRYVESIWLIDNYYSGIFTNKPIAGDITEDENLSKVTSIDMVAVNNIFEQRDSEIDMSQFNDLFASILQKALASIKRCFANSQANYDKFKSMAESTKPKGKTTSLKSKEEKVSITTRADGDLIKENLPKILDEWQCAARGEVERASLRLELIKFNALESIGEFMRATGGAFHQIYDGIRNKYRKETESIRKVCQLFQTAVEQERPLQKELIFKGDTFYINPEINLFENPLPVPDLRGEEVEEDCFTISQLSKLVDILLDISPTGYIPKISFVYLIQDIVCDAGGFQSMVPPAWKNCNSYAIKMVIDELFDELEYVYWKDFIVYNIRIPFPAENELILVRKLLRNCDPDCTELVYNYQFYSIKLWFEFMYKTEDSDKIQDIKRLLMKMYSVGHDQINYTALLLDFCKDDNPIVGFAKALELSLGKLICWNRDDGEAFKNSHLQKIAEHDESVRLRDAEIKDHYDAVLGELENIVDQIVLMEEGVVIEDVTNEQPRTRKSSILKRHIFNDEDTKKRSSKDEDVKFKEEHDVKYIEDTELSAVSENASIVQTLPNNVDTDASDYLQMTFFLPLDNLVNVITASLPWHSRVHHHEDLSFLEQVVFLHTKLANPVFNMSVLCHEYLNNEEFRKLLALTKKFTSKDPLTIIKTVMQNEKQ
ncbi:hypothetical protein GWI33_021647 [Rhynchophorus ferrugineus]|uniref:Sperm flagellar protein 2 n=1 Tax=Rhynchophorus ferrugineus TaxID=354439 RepID=A0A834IR48_RHYFE|nr:hypothetical protein GWI33_021647 [Rhynchophorus ferrugineus]